MGSEPPRSPSLAGKATGVTIREARPDDGEAIARVHVETWRSTYAGLVPAEAHPTLAARRTAWQRILGDPQQFGFTFLAERETDGVLGFATGGPERAGDPDYRGEIYAAYVLAAHQRCGIGRRLVQAVAHRLAGGGLRSVLVWVLAANPSTAFYARLGARPVRRRVVTLGGPALPELGYGWDDTVAAGLVEPPGPPGATTG